MRTLILTNALLLYLIANYTRNSRSYLRIVSPPFRMWNEYFLVADVFLIINLIINLIIKIYQDDFHCNAKCINALRSLT